MSSAEHKDENAAAEQQPKTAEQELQRAIGHVRPVKVVLVRHGETDWNANKIFQGHADPPLNKVGRAQAEALARHIGRRFPHAQILVTSDLKRASETAGAIASRLPGAQLVEDARFREFDVGLWSGKTFKEIARTDPVTLGAWITGEDVSRGGGETRSQVLNRVMSALGELVPRARQVESDAKVPTVIIVTHGGTIQLTVATVFGRSSNPYLVLETSGNACVNVLLIEHVTELTIIGRLEAYNEMPYELLT